MIEGSGSIPLTNGSETGSRRPKNMWIRIRNIAFLVAILILYYYPSIIRIRQISKRKSATFFKNEKKTLESLFETKFCAVKKENLLNDNLIRNFEVLNSTSLTLRCFTWFQRRPGYVSGSTRGGKI